MHTHLGSGFLVVEGEVHSGVGGTVVASVVAVDAGGKMG